MTKLLDLLRLSKSNSQPARAQAARELAEVIPSLLRRLWAAEKALAYSRGWYSDSYCPFCMQTDGTHTPECLYLEWLDARQECGHGNES